MSNPERAKTVEEGEVVAIKQGARFSHLYSIAFTVESGREDAADVKPYDVALAVLTRLRDVIDSGEWREACMVEETTEVRGGRE